MVRHSPQILAIEEKAITTTTITTTKTTTTTTNKAPIHYQALSYDRQTLTIPSDSALCLIAI